MINDVIVLDDYELNLVEGFTLDKSDVTKRTYLREVNAFCKHINKPLLEATDVNGADYLAYLRKDGKASSTIRRIYDNLKAFYNYLFLNGFIKLNPFYKIPKPEASKQINPDRTPGAEEFKIIIDRLKDNDPRTLAIIFLVATTGQRIGKILQIRWSDFIYAKDHIALKLGTQYIKVLDGTFELINQYRISMGIPDSYLDKPYFVFINNKSLSKYLEEPLKCKHITQRWIRNVTERICNDANIPVFTPKDLRHAFAVYALNFGIKSGKDKNTVVREVTEQMGLSSSNIVTRYNGVIEQLLCRAGTYPESFFKSILKETD